MLRSALLSALLALPLLSPLMKTAATAATTINYGIDEDEFGEFRGQGFSLGLANPFPDRENRRTRFSGLISSIYEVDFFTLELNGKKYEYSYEYIDPQLDRDGTFKSEVTNTNGVLSVRLFAEGSGPALWRPYNFYIVTSGYSTIPLPAGGLLLLSGLGLLAFSRRTSAG